MRHRQLILIGAMLLLLVSLFGCASQKQTTTGTTEAKSGIYGTWKYSMNGSRGTLTGKMVISDRKGFSSVTIDQLNIDAPVDVADLHVDGKNFHFAGIAHTDQAPIPFTITGTIDGDHIAGTIDLTGTGVYQVTGERVQ